MVVIAGINITAGQRITGPGDVYANAKTRAQNKNQIETGRKALWFVHLDDFRVFTADPYTLFTENLPDMYKIPRYLNHGR